MSTLLQLFFASNHGACEGKMWAGIHDVLLKNPNPPLPFSFGLKGLPLDTLVSTWLERHLTQMFCAFPTD